MPPSASSRYRIVQIVSLLLVLALLVAIYNNWYTILNQIVEWQRVFHSLLAAHIRAINENPFNHGIALIALSFGYGVFHAVGPGHGKAVIITYLGSNKESLRRGAVISLMAAMLQAMVAVLLIVILAKVLSIRFSDVSDYADNITSVSYLLVMALGLYLFITALTQQWRHSQKRSYEHQHHHACHDDAHHHHDHTCCGGHHAHQSSPQEPWLESMSVVLSMGIRPCAGAIVVLIYAHLVDAFFYGVIATLVMGLGTGLSIAGIALGTQLARNWFEKFAKSYEVHSYFNARHWLRMAGGIIIFFLGFSLFQSAVQVSANHPLI